LGCFTSAICLRLRTFLCFTPGVCFTCFRAGLRSFFGFHLCFVSCVPLLPGISRSGLLFSVRLCAFCGVVCILLRTSTITLLHPAVLPLVRVAFTSSRVRRIGRFVRR